LLILEAMKMENEIRAEGEGTVAKIHVEEGVAVNSNDPLVTIQ
jgi:biotin carboxyl carrier protein